MDGQSLTPLLGEGAETQNWRKDFLVELYRHLPPAQNGDVIKALRTEHEVYVEYRSGPRELYDLRTDPYQLQNIYATADPGHIADLSRRLAELAVSTGRPGEDRERRRQRRLGPAVDGQQPHGHVRPRRDPRPRRVRAAAAGRQPRSA